MHRLGTTLSHDVLLEMCQQPKHREILLLQRIQMRQTVIVPQISEEISFPSMSVRLPKTMSSRAGVGRREYRVRQPFLESGFIAVGRLHAPDKVTARIARTA
jgi:hypothetical protein